MAWRHVAATTAAGYKAFWSDKEIVLAAVAQRGCAFQYADESLRSDREVVLAAVSAHVHAALEAAEEAASEHVSEATLPSDLAIVQLAQLVVGGGPSMTA